MDDQTILSMVIEALDEVAPGKSAEIGDKGLNATIRDLGIDSVATMEMVGVIEERLDATFPDEELVAVNCLNDLAKMIRSHAE